jgi:hypothetical protein
MMNFHSNPPSWLQLESIIPLRKSKTKERSAEEQWTAETITGLSEDTIKRRYPEKVRQLSRRRIGMRLADALAIVNGE